jgi:hypothetical protein
MLIVAVVVGTVVAVLLVILVIGIAVGVYCYYSISVRRCVEACDIL